MVLPYFIKERELSTNDPWEAEAWESGCKMTLDEIVSPNMRLKVRTLK